MGNWPIRKKPLFCVQNLPSSKNSTRQTERSFHNSLWPVSDTCSKMLPNFFHEICWWRLGINSLFFRKKLFFLFFYISKTKYITGHFWPKQYFLILEDMWIPHVVHSKCGWVFYWLHSWPRKWLVLFT